VDPIKVKVYGLFPVTRQKYTSQFFTKLILSSAAVVVTWSGVQMLASMSRAMLGPRRAPKEAQELTRWLEWMPVVMLVIVGLVIVEGILIFRAFARKEAEQLKASKEQPAPVDSSGEAPKEEPR
jgi:hypothetical protein